MIRVRYIEWMLVMTYLGIVVFGGKSFDIWSQITYVLQTDADTQDYHAILALYETGQVHFLRVLLIFPYYFISNCLSMNLQLFFSISLVFFVYMIYRINAAILQHYIPRRKLLILLVFYILLSLFMHGRLVFSMLGNSVLLYILYRNFYSEKSLKHQTTVGLFVLSLWLVSVSTGTFMVFLGSVILFFLLQALVMLPKINRKYVFLLLMFGCFIMLISPLILKYIDKNLAFFDGSFIAMMSHGIGGVLKDSVYLIVLSCICFSVVCISLQFQARRNNLTILPIAMMFSAFFVGLFGYSSLLSGVPAFMLYFHLTFSQAKLTDSKK